MAHDYTEQELAAMTPAEREAVDYELNDAGPSVVVDESAVEAANAAKTAADDAAAAERASIAATAAAAAEAAADPAAAAAAEAAAALEAARAVAAAPAPAPSPAAAVEPAIETPFIPVFKAALVTDDQHAAAQAALAKRFEEGEVTTPEFIAENDKLTRAKMNSDFAQQNSEQNEEQSWQFQQDQFFNLPGNAVIRDDARVWGAMQAQLEVDYANPAMANYTNAQFLQHAGAEVRKLFGITDGGAPAATLPKAPAALSSVAIPQGLADVPIADAHAATAGEFSAVDKLDGMEFEAAIASMTPAQRERYMAQ